MRHCPRYNVRRVGDAWCAALDIPIDGAMTRVEMLGWNPVEAMRRAARVARLIVDDPIVQALLPPQAQVAIKAAQVLSKAAKEGRLDEAIARFRGPGVKRLLRALAAAERS